MSNQMLKPVVAYASLALPDSDSDLALLREWCSRIPVPLDLVAEEISPAENTRPLWADLLNQIELGAVTTLIVPSLDHIAGADFVSLSNFLTFLKAHKVILKSLVEIIDSRRDSKTDIVLSLLKTTENGEQRGVM